MNKKKELLNTEIPFFPKIFNMILCYTDQDFQKLVIIFMGLLRLFCHYPCKKTKETKNPMTEACSISN